MKARECSGFYPLDVVIVDTELLQRLGEVPGHSGQLVVGQVELLHTSQRQESSRVHLRDEVVHQDQSLPGKGTDRPIITFPSLEVLLVVLLIQKVTNNK